MVGAALQTDKIWHRCAIHGSEAFVRTEKERGALVHQFENLSKF